MKDSKKLVRIYTGTEVSVIFLKAKLEEFGIPVLVKNDYLSGISAGFGSGVPSAIDLYIEELYLESANGIINEFIQNKND